MKTVFVDTNVVLDVLLQNEGLWQDSMKIFGYTERREIRAFISAPSITDIFYVARKRLTAPVARAAIEDLLNIFGIVGVDYNDLRGALAMPIDDVEDALQAWCAKKADAETIVTNNKKDFRGVDVPAVTPAEFSA